MRADFEALELRLLAPYAVKSVNSRGRFFDEPEAVGRTCFQRDRDRIVHSKAFRRLKHKTQVFVATESDHYRSRLTHTIEVAQISRHFARYLRLNEDLCECIALAHDLGHTPFGHAGERVLNQLMQEHGGFEHNYQSRRIVDELEHKYPMFPGLNLSFEVREGLIKHQSTLDQPHLPKRTFMSLEAQVCNLADEIAYNNHDIDDGIRSGLVSESELSQHVTLWHTAKQKIKEQYHHVADTDLMTLVNSQIITWQIEDAVTTAAQLIKDNGIKKVEDIQSINTPIIRFSPDMAIQNKEMRHYLFSQFYTHPTVYRMNRKGQEIIRTLFHAYHADPKLLPRDYQVRINETQASHRIICDYIAGMTDSFAAKELEALF